jgi:hypothetical protein
MEERVQPLQLQMELGLAQLQLELLMYSSCIAGTWLGLADTDWNNAANCVMVLFHLQLARYYWTVLISLQ